MNRHRCGGSLQPQKVKIKKRTGFYYQTFTVDGFKCDYCGEELISRDVAFNIDKTVKQLKDGWKDWRIHADSKVTVLVQSPHTESLPKPILYEDSLYHYKK